MDLEMSTGVEILSYL